MESLKEKLQNLTVAEAVSYGVAGLGAVIGLAAIVTTVAKTGSYNDKIFSMEAQCNQLKGTLSQSVSQEEDVSSETEGEETVDYSNAKGSAQQSGVAVANYMNRYIPITLDNPNAGASDLDKRSALDEMLNPLFAESDKGAATSWYDPAHINQTGTGNNFTWSFESAYSYRGESLPVMWICRNNRADNAVVAYATAVYDTETGLFSGVSRYVTKEGAERAVGYVSDETYGLAMPGTDSGNELDEENDTVYDEDGTVSGNSVSDDLGVTGGEEDLWSILEEDLDDASNSSSQSMTDGTSGTDDNGNVPGTNSGSDTGEFLPDELNEEDLGLPPGFFDN